MRRCKRCTVTDLAVVLGFLVALAALAAVLAARGVLTVSLRKPRTRP